MAKKKTVKKTVGAPKESLVKVKVLKDYEDHKKGDTIMVKERKVRDTAYLLRRGYIKPV